MVIKAESVVPNEPVRTTEANLGRHFLNMHYAKFSQNTAQFINTIQTALALSALEPNFEGLCKQFGSR